MSQVGPPEIGVPFSDPATRGNIGGTLSGTAYSIVTKYRATGDLAHFARYTFLLLLKRLVSMKWTN